MTKKSQDYILGLDIGTENNGHAAMTKDFVVMKHRHVREIGVSQFTPAKPAADRRTHREMRRRYNHRSWRLKQLKNYFTPHFLELGMTQTELDEYFRSFKTSWISKKDPKVKNGTLKKQQFNQELHKFPTLFHAILALEEKGNDKWIKKLPEDKVSRLKLIYEVVHKLAKNRGNFLRHENVSDFYSKKIGIEHQLMNLISVYIDSNKQIKPIDLINLDFSGIVTKNSTQNNKFFPEIIAKLEKKENLLSIFIDNSIEKKVKKAILTDYLKLFLNENKIKNDKAFVDITCDLILGNKVSKTKVNKVNKVFNVDLEKDEFLGLQFGQDDSEDQYENLRSLCNAQGTTTLDMIRKLYNVINLADIITPGSTYAESMLKKYNSFKSQKRELVSLINKLKGTDSIKADKIKNILSEYLNHHRKYKKISHSVFIKKLEAELPENSKIREEIENDAFGFMQKQRNDSNSIIPHQVYQLEIRKIVEVQSAHPGFEWLKSHDNGAKSQLFKDECYDLERFIDYKIPYYIGPIVENKKSKNAWVVFNSNEKLTIWNLEKVIDFPKTAERFIRRMTATDTYLLQEPVLAKSSITYQEFEVLDEISNVRYLKNNQKHRLTAKEQQKLSSIFLKKKSVTKKELADFLKVKEDAISGLAKKDKFLSSMSTYYDFKKIIGDVVDKYQYREALDNIAEILTIFEANSFKLKENRINILSSKYDLNLTSEQIGEFSRLSYSGWGRLSNKLLNSRWIMGSLKGNGNRLYSGKEKYSILECLRNTNLNFVQLVNRKEVIKQINDFNAEKMDTLKTKREKIDFFLKNSRLSPMHERSIRNLLTIVEEYTKFNSKPPKMISLESANGSEKPLPNMYSRIHGVEDKLSGAKAIFNGLENQNLSLREYLYFTQDGKDIYDGAPLDYQQLNSTNLEIDHIYPQSVNNKRNDLGNLVLTKSKNNQRKGAKPAITVFENMRPFWKELYKRELISKRKYQALTIDWKKDKSFAKGMIARSLVETRGIIKSTADILTILYPDTKIVTVSSSLTMGLRQAFDLYKVRNVNDFHHGVDAFLAAFIGWYMWKLYPKLRTVLDYNNYSRWDAPEDLTSLGLSALTVKSGKKHPRIHNGQLINNDGEIIGNKEDLIKKLTRWSNPKFVKVIKHPMLSEDGILYKVTLYNKGKKLLPIKKNRNTQIYGGYQSPKTAYTILLKDSKGKYEIKNLPNIWIRENLDQLIKKLYPNQKVILDRILPGTEFRIVNKNKKNTSFSVYSADGPTNNNQLYLPDEVMRFLKYIENNANILKVNKDVTFNEKQCKEFNDNYKFLNKIVSEEDSVENILNIAFAKIIQIISNYAKEEIPLLMDDTVVGKVQQISEIFESEDLTQIDKGKVTRTNLEEKKYIIDEILIGLHANRKRCDLDEKIPNDKGRIKFSLGRKKQVGLKSSLQDDTLIVFNSVTGFKKKVLKLSELK